MTTFVANGLLGSTTLLSASNSNDALSKSEAILGASLTPQTGFHAAGEKQQEAPAFSFESNGLLSNFLLSSSESGTAGVRSEDEPSVAASSSSFTLSGLLGKSSLPSFAPSGLLDGTKSAHLSTPILAGYAARSPDADPLPVAEAFGVPSHLLSNSDPTHTRPKNATHLSVRATTFDGKTIYLRRRTKVLSRGSTSTTSTNQRMNNLLDVPIHRLMDALSSQAVAKLQKQDQNNVPQSSNESSASEDILWVDRYRPHKFTELMGNERVARDTMAWLKQWDWCVFGRKRGRKRPRDGNENFDKEDEYHRPQEKFLLLSGPPGLGKTTLAHVVANQAGYEVMEINASDARSGQIVDDRIRPALEAGSAVGSAKPVLLIIDEIDGATGAGESSNTFIHKLVQLTQDKRRKKQRSGQKRDHDVKRPILRPIICICNDVNASSLAKLRPHALQIRFTRPSDVHTAKRLREICEIEGLKADSRALSTLVGLAKCDLRSCLNTLQFVKSRNEEVTESVIRRATSGMGAADSSVVSVLNSIFNPLSKKRVKELALTDDEESRYVGRLSHEIGASGRESGIAAGCFGHYALLRRHDANLARHERATEWLTTFDHFSSAMYSDGDFSLHQYLSYTLVPFYPLFQERGGERVERNQADWEHTQLTRTNEEIYKSFSGFLRTAVRHGGHYRHLVSTPILHMEFAPLINRIISPPLRPVNSQIIRPEERALMKRLVHIMASLELRFVQERAEDGVLSYRLDPPIDVFVTYDGKRATDISVSRYAVRHLVAGEIDAKLIERDANIVEKGKRGKHDFFGNSTKSGELDLENSEHPSKRAKKDTTDVADKPPTDFFGRLITVPSASSAKAAVRKNVEKKYRVSYRFAEGNSAAVRRPVKINMFL